VRVKARGFELVIDEPAELGGEDTAPNPVEYVLAGWVGCVNVVAHLVARDLGIEIRNLEISAQGPLNPDRLFGKPTGDRAGFRELQLDVSVDSDADEETLRTWIDQVEARCPVSDNLVQQTPTRIHVRRLTTA
jgi:uncharacterized OsmC-like protein